jgi:hypothetical protein
VLGRCLVVCGAAQPGGGAASAVPPREGRGKAGPGREAPVRRGKPILWVSAAFGRSAGRGGAAMAAAAARVPFPHARGCAPAIPPARSSGSPGAVVQMGQAAGSGSVPACVRLPMDCVSHDK